MADDAVRTREGAQVHSKSLRDDDRTRVLRDGDSFAVFDRFGDVEQRGPSGLGLYHQDTRFLSRWVLRIAEQRPLLLSSSVKLDNLVLGVDLTNADAWRGEALLIPGHTVHVFRSKVLWQGACQEWLRIHNYGRGTAEIDLSLAFDADFADIFEVQGAQRARRGTRRPARTDGKQVLLSYEGLDGRLRTTRIAFDRAPDRLDGSEARFHLRLAAREEAELEVSVTCAVDDPSHERPARRSGGPAYQAAVKEARSALRAATSREPAIFTSNEQFNDLLNRSLADLHMMRTETPHGAYPYAGVPWFNTAFGRDGLITALQCLWFSPDVARGVLGFLAATQAEGEDPLREAQPGKILHETRAGEMAALGEVPFRHYYGTVDATPLFVALTGAYFERTGDAAFAAELWPHLERALAWIDAYGDIDGDGFVEYAPRAHGGLVQQGWKDSDDSVFHRDGSPAAPPIALCEVQGYVYAARRGAARIADALGKPDRAQALEDRAAELRRRFEAAFWCEELSTYALALDGDKRPCRIRTSNAAHCLFAGIADPERAARVARTLTDEPSFSGWGVRTLASSEARYSPISYHNGSIWPHDNALAAAGFARYGLKQEAARVLAGLFDASLFFDLHRLPELFCGFRRRPDEGPTLYPASCAPQAWASGAVLLMLQACLGLEGRAGERKLSFANPMLPDFLQEVQITGLQVGPASVDLVLTRHGSDVGVNVVRRSGPVEVVVVK